MLPLGLPPAPPAVVLFEESIRPERSCVFSHEWFSFVDASFAEITQVTITDTIVFTARLDPVSRVAELRSVHTSLNKKARQERMSTFEREYPW
jgi:hypothetical protein